MGPYWYVVCNGYVVVLDLGSILRADGFDFRNAGKLAQASIVIIIMVTDNSTRKSRNNDYDGKHYNGENQKFMRMIPCYKNRSPEPSSYYVLVPGPFGQQQQLFSAMILN